MEREPQLMRELFFRHVGQTTSSPLALEIEKAKGVFLYSKEKRYIDLISGVSVSNLGHGNDEVLSAVRDQVENYAHLMVYGEMIEAPQVLHAQLLTSVLPDTLDSVYYVNSGSEANEAALKLAKRVTGRWEMISCYNAYHGSTHGALSMMGSESFKNSFRPLLPGVTHIRFNNLEDLLRITERTACVLIEPVQGEGGVILPEDGYLKALRQRCDETGTLLIFDEVQLGFGRTGSLFAFEKYGVIPDILVLAKALGGGFPLGALVTSYQMMSAWQSNPSLGHITTFGGHPVSCAAALASLKILLRDSLISDVERKSDIYYNGLKDHKEVIQIRRAGLLLAVDLGDVDKAGRIIPILLENGVMSDWFMFHPTSFRIAPPLTISDQEILQSIDIIEKSLKQL